ncbi:hypothetical protein B0O80DRAFT_465842 [Mortierella sp. GBAus27b]|nr:hypothetical protein B0O80DRAFT_465842 [Mortierella sp. GBAus27b]
MRASVVALIAAVAAVANALDYPFQSDGPCVSKCLSDAGKSLYSSWTDDPNSPNFIESLSYAHERGTDKYRNFMTKAGMCMGPCPAGTFP